MLETHLKQMEADLCWKTKCTDCPLYYDREGNRADCCKLPKIDKEHWKRSILEYSLRKGKIKSFNPIFKIEATGEDEN